MKSVLIAIVGLSVLAAIGCGAVVALEVLRPDGVNTNSIYTIIGIIAPTMAVLLGWLKSIVNGQQIEKKSEEIKDKIAEQPKAVADAGKNALHDIENATAEGVGKLKSASTLAPPKH